MRTEIISAQNPRVKEWSALLSKKGRDEQNRYLLEGMHLVKEALAAAAPVETILYSIDKGLPAEIGDRDRLTDVELVAVSDQVLSKCSDTGTPQGIVAVAGKTTQPIGQFWNDPNALVVAADGIQDPGNLGTIIRSADAVGATGIVLGKGTVDLYNPKTIRSTMGSLFHLPIANGDLASWLKAARERGLQVVGTSLSASRSCYELNFTQPTCIVVGNEGRGVSAEIDTLVSERVIIPMPGRAESLNVAMAATVLLFEAVRQRAFCTNKNSCPPTN